MLAVMVLVDIAPSARLWGWSRLALGRFSMQRIAGLEFFKILGSGKGGGFNVTPSPTHQGLFCVFRNDDCADDFLNRSAVMAAYRDHARELFSVKLKAYSSKGSWSGMRMDITAEPPQGRIASLTRASIHPLKAGAFWRMAPPAEKSLSQAEGCLLSAGLGEAPYLRQATFSIWESSDHMARYARQGAHLQAIQKALAGEHFSESMFTRFVPYDLRGSWKGKTYA